MSYFSYGIEINSHPLPGVYCVSIGNSKRKSGRFPVSILCTLRVSLTGDMSDGELQEPHFDHGPIRITYQGNYTLLRPWSPSTCIFAAAIQHRLVHFPIRPRNKIFVIGASLHTLSHLADILGPTGVLVGVLQKGDPSGPSPEDMGRFSMRHRQVWLVQEDIEKASLEKYELLLSLPLACKHAFLMGLHERLGAGSPLHLLAGVEQRKDILKLIFDFVEFPEVRVRALVVCHCPPGTSMDAFWEMTSNHMEILLSWRSSPAKVTKRKEAKPDKPGEEERSGYSSSEDGRGETKAKKEKERGRDEHRGQMWVMLDLPTNHLVMSSNAQDVNAILSEVEAKMKMLPDGRRTGLHAKEHLLLPLYFPDHALLLLKYSRHRDERRGDVVRRSRSSADKDRDRSAASGAEAKRTPAPSTKELPVPKFGTGDSLPASDGTGAEKGAPSFTPFQAPNPPGLRRGPPGPPSGVEHSARRSIPTRSPPAPSAQSGPPQGKGARQNMLRYSDDGYEWEASRQYGGTHGQPSHDHGSGHGQPQWSAQGKGPGRGVAAPADQGGNVWGGPAGCGKVGGKGLRPAGPGYGAQHQMQQHQQQGWGGGGGYSEQPARSSWSGHHGGQDYQQASQGHGHTAPALQGMPHGGARGHQGFPGMGFKGGQRSPDGPLAGAPGGHLSGPPGLELPHPPQGHPHSQQQQQQHPGQDAGGGNYVTMSF